MIIIRILFFSLRKVSYRTSVTFQRIKKETDCRPETVSYLILIYEIMAGFIESRWRSECRRYRGCLAKWNAEFTIPGSSVHSWTQCCIK